MGLTGIHPFAIVMCKMADQPQEPQPPDFFRALFTGENRLSWAQPFEIQAKNFVPPGARVAALARNASLFGLPWIGGTHLDIFWIGADGAVWSNWWDTDANQGRWNTPFSISPAGSAKAGDAVTAVSRTSDHIDVFWIDNAGAVASAWWDSGTWHLAFRVTQPNAGIPGGSIASVARTNHNVDVFWVDQAGAVSTAWWDQTVNNAAWNSAFRISAAGAAPAGAGVAALARASDHIDVFWVGGDGAAASTWWDAKVNHAAWNAPFRISGANTAPAGAGIAAVSRVPDHMDVFWADNGGAIGSAWWDAKANNGLWNTPFRVTSPSVAPAGSQVAACGRTPNHVDVFWIGLHGEVSSCWWDANANSARWNPPFQVAGPNSAGLNGGIAAVARKQEQLDVFWGDKSAQVSSAYWPSSTESIASFWSDMSYGQFKLDGTDVFGWYTLSLTLAQFTNLSRSGKIQACIDAAKAAGVNIPAFYTTVAIGNVQGDSGTDGQKRSILTPGAWNLGFAAHESGHCLGLDHSFDDSAVSCDPRDDSRPGAYNDSWDIMSFACYGKINPMFTDPLLGPGGPGLNAPYRDKLGWIASNRIFTLSTPNSAISPSLAALNHPEAPGYLMIKIIMNSSDLSTYYTLEFRRKEGWDRGINKHCVLIHQVKNGLSYLQRSGLGAERTSSSPFEDPTGRLKIAMPDFADNATSVTVKINLH